MKAAGQPCSLGFGVLQKFSFDARISLAPQDSSKAEPELSVRPTQEWCDWEPLASENGFPSPGWSDPGTLPFLPPELTLALALALALFWSKYLATSVCPARAAMCNGVSTFCKVTRL